MTILVDHMPGVGLIVRVVGLGSLDPEFKSYSAVELIPGGVDSACHPSEVGKMSASLLRIRARPACDQPLYSNGDRVAHRTDNSVVALLELSPETGHGQGFNPAPSHPRTIRAG